MTWEPSSLITSTSYLNQEGDENSDYHIKRRFDYFFRHYQNTENELVYLNQLQQCIHTSNPSVTISIDNFPSTERNLVQRIYNEPERCIRLFEEAVHEFAKTLVDDCPPIQVLLTTNATPIPLREIKTGSDKIHKLVVVPGLIISASTVSSKAILIQAKCKDCGHIIKFSAYGSAQLPAKCQSDSTGAGKKCSLNPYTIMPDDSKFVDHQYLKFQESPEDVPPGQMPQHITAVVDRSLTNTFIPGTRYNFVAVVDMIAGKGAVQKQILKIVGVADYSGTRDRLRESISSIREKFPDRKSVISAIAPKIYGMDDVKEAIACQLFGGVRKNLPDGMSIRGDINVLLLGDPSMAKSQLLKYAYQVAPIGVYTSGKGSSAAGLTATVVRRKGTGEFFLEGGAMVLADGGLVCIDEFDKMRDSDRVAIHEAMEQQTISIAKAGITAVLNTRTSVLAAANPIQGRFNDLKSARDNVDFQTTILSRFDLIFVLRDIRNKELDESIARRVFDTHANRNVEVGDTSGEILINNLREYIRYARESCAPTIGDAAMNFLKTEYVNMRSQVDNAHSIPITVRQLEALVRTTESLAKMELQDECTEAHVQEAIRLFKVSTFSAASSGIVAPDGVMNEEQRQEVERVQNYINRRMPVGARISETALMNELRRTYSDFAIIRVLQSMLYSGQIEYTNGRKQFKRVKNNVASDDDE